jgi:carbonic anhydrase
MCITSCGKTRNAPSQTKKIEWGYEAKNGPQVWAQLSPEYFLCAEGKHQSPIDLVNPTPVELPPIPYNYRPTSMNIRNTGHTIEVACPEGSWIEVDGTRYQLLQFHFHAPSEHTVAGKPFEIEAHFVHKSDEGNLAVVGLLIEKGRHNSSYDPVWDHLPAVPGEAQRVEVDENHPVDPRTMLSPNGQVTDEAMQPFQTSYRYEGSLTTPPCSESVKWIVLTTPIEMSEAQIAAFKAIIHDNNRPVQPLNGRKLLVNVGANE